MRKRNALISACVSTRETGFADGDARERPVFRPGQPTCRKQSWALTTVCAGGAAWPVAALARAPVGARRGPTCPVARAPGDGCCPAGSAGDLPPPRVRRGRIEVIVTWRRGRRLGRCAAGISRWPGTPARCFAARAWRRLASAAGARTASRPVRATGSGRDAIPGPAPADHPAPPSRATGRGDDTGAAVTCAFTAWPGSGGAAPGIPRSCRYGLAGLALAGCQCLLRAAVSPHRPS